MTLNEFPKDLNPKGLHIHPDWAGHPDWPTFKKVLREWVSPIQPDLVKAVESGDIPCITGVTAERLKLLRGIAGKHQCHIAGYLVLVPCDGEVVDDAQTCDATGPETELPGASGDDDSEDNGTD